jgi:hypothetical protein
LNDDRAAPSSILARHGPRDVPKDCYNFSSISTARPAFLTDRDIIAVGASQLSPPERSGVPILFIALPALALKDPFVVVVHERRRCSIAGADTRTSKISDRLYEICTGRISRSISGVKNQKKA